ncbi:MAG: hypothetical protein IKU68_05345 [Oscillospiraceae bacterium]|nr:hypothetical protein [Oscillospiraceae bacterium]
MKKRLIFLLICLCLFLCSCGCNHQWDNATCSAPKTCTLCGTTEGSPLVHVWQDPTCSTPKVCALCGVTEGNPLTHIWQESTCTTPKHCTLCQITDGDVVPHNWISATCTSPKICFDCKKSEGIPNGHSWSEATCISAKKCTVCGVEEGSPLGHSLESITQLTAPTCLLPGEECGICSRCKETLSQTTPLLEHIPGAWFVSIEATYDASGEKSVKCTSCDTILNTESYELTDDEKEIWYKNACETLKYTDFARNPENYIGQRIKITGEVLIVIEEPNDSSEASVYLVFTKKEHGFYSGDQVIMLIKNNDSRTLEGDIITFYGELDGLYDDWGDKHPKMNVVYYDLK